MFLFFCFFEEKLIENTIIININIKYSFFILRLYSNTTFENISIKCHDTYFEIDLISCTLFVEE